MGRVWRAADEILDRQVAVKEMRIDGVDAEDGRTRRERTLREARATARIDHPNVVRVYDVVDEGERLWIVMELVAGRSLEQVVLQDGPLSPAEAARVGLGLVAALRQVHAGGVLHRDIKPGNVLVEHGGRRVVLTDFGIAAIQDAKALTMAGMLVGSPDYMAPERVSGRPQGPPSDVWSLGATLCAALGGRSPFARATTLATLHAVLHEEPSLPPAAGPLGGVLAALLRKEPAARPGLDDLEAALEPVAFPPPTPTLAVTGPAGTGPARTGPAGTGPAAGGRAAPAPAPEPAPVPAPAPTPVPTPAPLPGTRPDRPSVPPPGGGTFGRVASGAGTPGAGTPGVGTPGTALPGGQVGVPGRGRGQGRGRRRGAVLVTAVAAAVAAAVLGLVLTLPHGGDGGGDDGRGDTTAGARPPSAPGEDRPSGGGTPAPSGSGGATASPTVEGTSRPPSLPPGAHWEAGGFGWATPTGWRRDVKTGAEVHYTSPDGTRELVAKSSLARGDLMESWRTSEQNAHQGRAYRKIRLERTTFRGRPAVVWEYTFTLRGTPWHALLLGFDANGKTYQINTWYQPDVEQRALETYDRVRDSFTVL
ncbi:protein kinase domain-containing protein [Streptomyces sp. NPDC003374]